MGSAASVSQPAATSAPSSSHSPAVPSSSINPLSPDRPLPLQATLSSNLSAVTFSSLFEGHMNPVPLHLQAANALSAKERKKLTSDALASSKNVNTADNDLADASLLLCSTQEKGTGGSSQHSPPSPPPPTTAISPQHPTSPSPTSPDPSVLSAYLNSLSSNLTAATTLPTAAHEQTIVHRLLLMKSVHAAMHHSRLQVREDIKASVLQALQHYKDEASASPSSPTKNKDGSSKGKGPMEYDKSLGVHMFYNMLAFLHTNDCSAGDRQEFLENVIPVLKDLEPLALETKHDPPNPTATAHPNGHNPKLYDWGERTFPKLPKTSPLNPPPKILDSLRKFLVSQAQLPNVSSDDDGFTNEQKLNMFRHQNKSAVTALAELSKARGQASDLLVVIKVLLGVGVETPWELDLKTQQQQQNQMSSPQHAAQASPSLALLPSLPLLADDAEEVEMDSSDRRKMEARKRMNKTGASTLMSSPRASGSSAVLAIGDNAGAEVVIDEEDRRMMIKQQQLKKKKPQHPVSASPSSDAPHLSSTPPTEEWLPQSSTSSIGKSKKMPSKPQHKLQPREDEGGEGEASRFEDDDESTLESASHTHLRPPILPILSNLNVAPLLSHISTSKSVGLQVDSRGNRQSDKGVWTCGQNSYGELAQGDTNPRKSYNPVLPPLSSPVIAVAAGNEHTALLTADGRVYTAGYNDNGQCGHGHQHRVSELTLVSGLPKNRKAVQVHAYNGCEHTMVVTDDGRLYSFGYNCKGQLGHGTTASEFIPHPVRGLEGKRVRVVSCSYYHSIVACESDETYSFGRNDFGQLGHNDTTEKKFPHPITQLKGQRVISLACGQYHSCVVTSEGRLLACGKNDYGQVGVEGSETFKRMVTVSGLENEIVTEVRCGYYHTLALTSKYPYSFGRNDYGQLGHSPTPRLSTPTPIPSLSSSITKIAAGCYHSVFAEAGGRVWVCGRNNHGQLGVGDCIERHGVVPIDTFVGKYISHIAAGFYHTIILTGADENDANSGSPDTQSFSSQKILSMPCMRWTQAPEDKSSGSSSAANPKVASQNNNESNPIDNKESNPDEILAASSPRGQPPFHHDDATATTSSMTTSAPTLSFPEEEDGKSLHSFTSTTPLPFDDQCSEVTLPTNAQTNQDMIESVHGSSLFEDSDNSCRQDKAALFLLAHMERLSSTLIPSPEDFPVVGLSSSTPELLATFKERVANNASKERFCVDVHPSTFHLLHSLIHSVHDPAFACTRLLDENRSFLILACLRILKANLSRLLTTKDVVGYVRSAMVEHRNSNSPANPHVYGGDTCSIDSNVLLTETIMPSHLLPVMLQPSFEDENANEATFNSTVQQYVTALTALHQVLIQVVEAPSFFNETAATVQSEAASTIILGLELFYPSQTDQVQLLSDLFACPPPRDGDREGSLGGSLGGDQMSAIEEDSQLRDALSAGLTASRFFLLDPLLERLSDDRIACYLVPNPLNFTIDLPDATVTPSMSASTNLNNLMKLLVKQLNLTMEQSPLDIHQGSNPHQFIDDDSMDGESANQYNRIKNHRKLISKLLLSLFKHTMHWAAGEAMASAPSAHAPAALKNSANPKAFLETTLSIVSNNPTPEGSSCLIEFTSLCLLHSVEFMTTLVNSSRQQKPISLLSMEDLNKIEHGVFGTILPSIILGMLPFAIRPTFAHRLLPLTTKFVQCLDELLELCPYLTEQQSEGKKNDGKSSMSSSQLNSSSPLPNKGSSFMGAFDPELSEETGLPTSNSSSAPNFPHMTPFPWISSLLKSSSLLAGNLAKTLIDKKNVDGGSGRTLKEGEGTGDPSVLCAHGIDAKYASVLSSHGLIPPNQHRLPPPAPPMPNLDSLCEVLRKNASSKDMSYSVVCKQVMASADCSRVLQFERIFFTAALKHDNLNDFVRMFVSSEAERDGIPCSLALAWRAVSEATKWLWSRRSQIKAGDNSEEQSSYQLSDLFRSVNSTLSLITVLSSSQPKSPLPVTGWLKPSTSPPRMRWRRTINMVICALRWMKIGRLASVHRSSPVSTHFTLSGEGAKQIFAHVTKYEKADSAQPKVTRSSETLSQLLESYNRSTTCVVGLNGFYNLFRTVKSRTTRSVLLREFTRAVRPNSQAFPTSCVVFQDLVAPDLRAAVHKSFEDVYLLFLEELKSFVPKTQPASHIFNHTNMHYYLLLLDAWGISFNSCRSFLSTCDVFETLSSLLCFFDGYSSDSEGGENAPGDAIVGGKNAVAPPTSLPPSSAARSTHRMHGSSSITKERLAHVARCRQATWAALRLLVSQAFTFETCPPPLSVLYHNITSAIKTMTTLPSVSSDPVDAKTSSSSRDHRKRCQELIGSPKQFCGSEDGMKFGPELLLHNSKGSDFSIAFWLYLTQDSTGKHRSLVVRGHKQERWPIILLRPQDRRLDIGYAPSSPIFSSSSAVPLNKWVHVALVSESNKLKLYFNGATDMHRQNPTHMNSPRTNKHSLYVGKVPDNAVKLDGVRSGFEGSVAFLRFYSRALSPIHVRIVYDQGPPSLVEARDRRCYQIAASLTLLKSGVLSTFEWRNVLLKMFSRGTARVAQGVIRLWMKNLPAEDVVGFGSVALGEDDEVVSVPAGTPSSFDFVSYLLRVLGLSLWKAGWRENGDVEKDEREDSEIDDFKPFFPTCITLSSGDKGKKETGKASQAAALDSTLLANEVTSLLQAMLSMEKWGESVTDILRSSLAKLQESLPSPDHFTIAESFATMKVLSQPDESLRPGVTCTMTHSDVPACVIAYDPPSNLCHCVVKNPPTYFAGGSSPDTRSIVKINGDDVILDSALKLSGWTTLSESRVVGEVIVPLAISLLKMREEAEKKTENALNSTGSNDSNGDGNGDAVVEAEANVETESTATEEVEAQEKQNLGEEEEEEGKEEGGIVPTDDDDAKSFSEDVPEESPSSAINSEAKEVPQPTSPKSISKADRVKEVFEDQALSRVLTLVHSITLTPLLSELLDKKLLSALTAHAVKSDGTSSCVHLHAVERAVSAMRLLPIFENGPGLVQTSPSTNEEGGGGVIGGAAGGGNIQQQQQDSQHLPLTGIVCTTCGSEYSSHVEDGRCDGCKQAMTMEGGAQEDLISQLIEMGFREEWCALALRENNNDVEFASTWIVDNLDFLGSLGGVVVENDNEDDFEVNENDGNVHQEEDRLPLIDNLESEGCRNIYEENYFPPADPNLHYNSERTNMVVNPELGSELLLGILRARASVVQLLPHFADEGGEGSFDVLEVFGNADPLIHFIKLSCFRGRQFDLFRWRSGENAEKDEHLVVQTLIQPFLECLAKRSDESGRAEEDHKEDDDKSQTTEASEEEEQGFISALLTVSLDDFEAAASINAFDEMAWGSRMLTASDSQALLQPNVELASYILDLLISNDSPCMYKSFTFQRISGGLMSANMPTKEICMKLMWRIVVGWRLRLESGEGKKGKPEIPERSEIVALLFDNVPLGRLKRIASQRAAEERRQERTFMSSYTQTMTQLVVGVEDLLEFIDAENGNGRDDDGDAVKKEGEEVESLPLVADLAMSVLSENAISVTWSRPAPSYTYDIEMSTNTSLDPGMPLNFTNIYSGPSSSCVVENLLPGRKYVVRARCRDPGRARVGEWCERASETSSPGVAFTFDRNAVGPSIFVSTDGLSASFGGNESWSTVLGSTPFISGVNSWKIRIDSSQTSYLFIGLATKQADTSSFLGGDEFGWGYIGDRALYHKRAKQKVYGEKFSQGDEIGVTLDMDKGTLSFSRNDEDLGVAFKGLAGELYPAVAFYNQSQRVSLVRTSFDCPKVGTVIEGSPASSDVGEVSKLSKILGSMAGRHSLEENVMSGIWNNYKRWKAGHSTRFMTLCNFELTFDSSPDALSKFGVKKGDKVKTARGPASVIGVSNGCLWVHVEGEQGCWFVDVNVKPTVVDDNNKEKVIVVGSEVELAEQETKMAEVADDGDEKNVGSYEEFLKLANSQWWKPSVDGLITSAVNLFVDRYEVSPWNLSPEKLMKAVQPSRAEINRIAGRDIRDEMICARYTVIMELNALLVNTLPFLGVGDVLKDSRSGAGEGKSRGGLAVGISCKDVEQKYLGSYGAGLGLGVLLAALRDSVFFVTKRGVVASLLERTLTQAKKAEDEYDYPEDLPQVSLNRPKAIAGRRLPNPFARISLSLFGQLFDELHFIEPAQLRIGYTHPMDDGQERTFKVKFDGEGVDDYGGPYREIFGQVAGELQALETDVAFERGKGRKAELGDSVRSVLPLLTPSRNWRATGGGPGIDQDSLGDTVMRAVVDQNGFFVPAPSLQSHVYMEMYSFIGQLIGIALRSRITTKFRFPPIVWKALVGEAVEVADVRAYDEAAYAVVAQVSALAKGQVEDFENAVGDLKFVATLSDGVEVELGAGGRSRSVTLDNCSEYVERLIECRLHESDKALSAMRDGLGTVVPATILPFLGSSELELLVCGKEGVDIYLLEANTEYDDDVDPQSDHIKSFWRVLRSFDDEDRSRFLRFVWARERLPNSGGEFHQRFKIQAAVGDGPRDNPDKFLPKAHTCFFSLNLPVYTSDEVMKAKILYAIYNCVEMDADFKLAESENSSWGDEVHFGNGNGGDGSGVAGGGGVGDGGGFASAIESVWSDM
ncbi:hypothetical protein TrST_g6277 [Triparma strigata]|uniref:HECT domain-containing protein n=1 Tax=Triparma strigata TaxID=1606541 RepID=A0A9W7C0D5_9STRA|nr:hypothetical protein TrST_g6277 [Triparma strigata]